MNIKIKYTPIVIFLLCSSLGNSSEKTPANFVPTFESERSHLIGAEERYVRLQNANHSIKPDEILKIGITYSYANAIDPFDPKPFDPSNPKPSATLDPKRLYVSKLPSVEFDRRFIDDVAPHITNEVLIDDSNKTKTLGGKDVIEKLINVNKGQKKVALVFFSGHGTDDGRTPIPTHTEYCKQLFQTLKIWQSENKKPLSQNPDWEKSECRNENYTLRMNDYKKFLSPLDIVMINDSDYSGIYLDMVNTGEFAGVIHSTSRDATTNYHKDYSDHPGGALMAELRMRLMAKHGCNLDGTNQRPKDRVLDLQEWVTGIENDKKANWRSEPVIKQQKMGLSVLSTHDIIKSIPIHIYTSAECKEPLSVVIAPWEDIQKRYPFSKKSMDDLKKTVNFDFSMEQFSLGMGGTFRAQ